MDALRVLMVDDEEELVGAVEERLKLRGVEARGVTTGAQALEALEVETFDVLLVDVKMPGLGGIDLVRLVKKQYPTLQVVLLTGHGSKEDAEEGMRLGAYDYLMKPIKIEQLLRVLRSAAGQAEDG